MSLIVELQIAENVLGFLEISRLQLLADSTRDIFTYQVQFQSDEWNGSQPTSPIRFKHRYSDGSLSLTQKAIGMVLKLYPELKAGRFGIPRNRIQCRRCKQIIWSRHRHDFVACRCGKVAVDGGYDYCSVSGKARDIIYVKESWQEGKR